MSNEEMNMAPLEKDTADFNEQKPEDPRAEIWNRFEEYEKVQRDHMLAPLEEDDTPNTDTEEPKDQQPFQQAAQEAETAQDTETGPSVGLDPGVGDPQAFKYPNQVEAEKAYKEAEKRMHSAIQSQKGLERQLQDHQEAVNAWNQWYQQLQDYYQQQEGQGTSREQLTQALMENPESFVSNVMDLIQQSTHGTKQEIYQQLQQQQAMAAQNAAVQKTLHGMEDHFQKKYGHLSVYEPVIQNLSNRVFQGLQARVAYGQQTTEDRDLLNLFQNNPEALVDRLVEMAMPDIKTIQESAGAVNGKNEVRQRLSAAPTVTPSGVVQASAGNEEQTPKQYVAWRQAQQKRALGAAL